MKCTLSLAEGQQNQSDPRLSPRVFKSDLDGEFEGSSSVRRTDEQRNSGLGPVDFPTTKLSLIVCSTMVAFGEDKAS